MNSDNNFTQKAVVLPETCEMQEDGIHSCPQCGKTGTPEEFSKGCPACGYTVESSAKNEKRLLKKEKKAPFLKRKALKNQINRFNNQTKNEKNPQNDENLPVWIFIFIFFIFLLIIYFFLKFF